MPPQRAPQDETSPPRPRAMDPNQMPSDDDDDELVGIEGEEDLDSTASDDALGSPHPPSPTALNLAPPPPYLREISTLASWTVSSSKPGCSIPQLRDPSPSLFWQSDGPQPHYLNIHFFKLVRIVGLRLYLDFEQDESYTPTKIVFLAGSGMNDLVEWGEMKLESPRGWVWADFSGVGEGDSEEEDEDEGGEVRMLDVLPSNGGTGAMQNQAGVDASSDSENVPQQIVDMQQQTPIIQHPHQHHQTPTQHYQNTPSLPQPISRPRPRQPFTSLSPHPNTNPTAPSPPRLPVLRAHLVQIKILENHQNGKDTHLRGLQIFARNDEREATVLRKGGLGGENAGRKGGRGKRTGGWGGELGDGFGEGGGIR